ncbi:hypothetical protein HPB48_000019 [Haemaphysalis longicornis]|uniref:Uncharacterized protein n=1 Tax=Haemaphysalis longicornis TaxID=44386 RepID=A0A9J6GER7_HAELO|nr:hypothetical protein HPB48_000019 [Haemaphysalis longicornis]
MHARRQAAAPANKRPSVQVCRGCSIGLLGFSPDDRARNIDLRMPATRHSPGDKLLLQPTSDLVCKCARVGVVCLVGAGQCVDDQKTQWILNPSKWVKLDMPGMQQPPYIGQQSTTHAPRWIQTFAEGIGASKGLREIILALCTNGFLYVCFQVCCQRRHRIHGI